LKLAHQQLLEKFNDEHNSEGSPLTLLFDPSMPGLVENETNQNTQDTSLNKQTHTLSAHRSFYDLLRTQAKHIEDMGRELEEAKRTIHEQKVISRAKLVVMDKFKLSENDAYRRLQKQAMSENTTIAAIATKVVTIAEKS
jgi:AmiR/NasT family two-component response regulator